MGTNLFSKDVKISEMFAMLKNLNLNEEQDINILLLGESGIGKSTFVNALANYVSYKKFKEVEEGNLMILIPTRFNIMDKNYDSHLVETNVEPDENECLDLGFSATQGVKTYVFPIGRGTTKLRIIDTPGIGDTRGLEQDRVNCENILEYLGKLEYVHAICCMFATNSSRINIFFDYCLKEILSRLHTSASNNLIFLFTNSGAAHFTPGDTIGILRTIAKDIEKQPPHIKISVEAKNTFCFENDNFRYLAAKKDNIEFDEKERKAYKKSWNHSWKECWRMISYIVGDNVTKPLTPHDIQNTVSINEARRLIVNLSKPLADISQMIQDNILVLDRHRQSLESHSLSIDDMKRKLYIPVIDLNVTELPQPVTVCASSKCTKMYPVGSIQKWDYSQRCHNPCYLTNVPKEIVGAPELVDCAAMDSTKTCTLCRCDFSAHMHVYYETRTVNSTIEDGSIKNSIISREDAVNKLQQLIEKTNTRKTEFEAERQKVVRYIAQFAHFLQNNAIIKYNDSYEKYIKYMIEREKSLGPDVDPKNIHQMEQLLREYKEAKQSFDNGLILSKQNDMGSTIVTAEMIKRSIECLYQLPHTGKKIRQLVMCQNHAQRKENKQTEYCHPCFPNMFSEDNLSDKAPDDKKSNKNKHQSESQNNWQRGNFRGRQSRGRGRGENYQYRNISHNTASSQRHSSQGNYPPSLLETNFFPPPYSSLYHDSHSTPHSAQNINMPSYGYHQNPNQGNYDAHRQPGVEIQINHNIPLGCGNPNCSDPSCVGYFQRSCRNPHCRDPNCQPLPMFRNNNLGYPQRQHHNQNCAPIVSDQFSGFSQHFNHNSRQGYRQYPKAGTRGYRNDHRGRGRSKSRGKTSGKESSNSADSD